MCPLRQVFLQVRPSGPAHEEAPVSLRPFLQLRRLQAAAGLVEAFPAGPQGLLGRLLARGPRGLAEARSVLGGGGAPAVAMSVWTG